ncbi:MAG: Hpt domain-containing protein, partial [Treponema sp.]|nr:Hpt domain-containing protein [Treponema sp.]
MSDYLDPNNEELLKDFFSEAQMQVETLEQNVLVLENEGDNKDAVDEIFRAAHTLKGGSATVEMMELSHFTHMVEDVLDAIRSDQLAVNEDVVDTLLAAIDIIKAMLEQRMNGAVYQEDTSQMEGRLEAMIPEAAQGKKAKAKPAPAAPAPAPVPVQAPPAAPSDLSETEIQELRETVSNGAPIYRVTVQFDENSLMNTVGGIQCYAALKGVGSILKTNPEFERLYEDTFFPTVDYYIAASKTSAELERYVTIPDVTLSCTAKTLDELAAQTP